jgi:hypothetical protein
VTKKQYKIMVWLIVWAGLLIVVLYSPIGSPDLYSSPTYYVINESSSAGNSTTLNAPKGNFESDNYSNDDTEIPDVSSESRSNYAVGNYQSAGESMQGSSYGVQSQSYYNNSSGSTEMSGGGSSFFAGGSSHGSAGSSGISMTNGMTTLSLTTNLSNNIITKQNATTYTSGTGGTDPGGDPTGNPIPVGDGWGIFILLGVIYAFIKVFYKGKCVPSEIKTTFIANKK